MALDDTLALPFFDDGHRRFAEALTRWADANLPSLPHGDDVDEACRARVRAFGKDGILTAVVPKSHGGLHPALDVRTLCLAREILAFRDGLADFAFVVGEVREDFGPQIVGDDGDIVVRPERLGETVGGRERFVPAH